MSILVTGGAGYIGSVIVKELMAADYETVVVDNLSTGHRAAVSPGADLMVADIRDAQALNELFETVPIDVVIHLAAESIVGKSVTDPGAFFETNLIGSINLVNTMVKHGVDRMIFSSSAAVYGEPNAVPIDEDAPQSPVNSYGESKLMFERVLKWYAKAHGLKYVALRYFNAAGAAGPFGEDHRPETHLIPIILHSAANGHQPIKVFGDDYPTKDGSCIRDYVHVEDIAQAHMLAMRDLDGLTGRVYNLGNGTGSSVREVIAAVERVTGASLNIQTTPRRHGDPAALVASHRKAEAELGWTPSHSQLDGIIESSWDWMRRHPEGYVDCTSTPGTGGESS